MTNGANAGLGARWALRFKQVARCQKGVSALELAVTLPIFCLVLGGIFDFGRYYWARNAMQFALEETARYAMVKQVSDTSSVQTYLRARVDGVPTTAVAVSTSVDTSGAASILTITATHTFASTFGSFVPLLSNRLITVRVKVPLIS